MTTSLTDLERLEFTIIDAMSRSNCTRVQFTELTETLEKVRTLKAQYLSRHPEVLRKGTVKLHTGPAPQDAPNAPSPDAMLDAPLIFRAPPALVGLVLHTIAGALAVPDSGIVEAAAGHTELHRELLGRGFRRLESVLRDFGIGIRRSPRRRVPPFSCVAHEPPRSAFKS